MRENINSLVVESAEDIASKVIEVAKNGQLASAKYLFEAVGLYPATEETRAKAPKDSLAYTLLRRMGLPTEPVICDEDPLPSGVGSGIRGMTREGENIAAEDPDGEGKGKQEFESEDRDK